MRRVERAFGSCHRKCIVKMTAFDNDTFAWLSAFVLLVCVFLASSVPQAAVFWVNDPWTDTHTGQALGLYICRVLMVSSSSTLFHQGEHFWRTFGFDLRSATLNPWRQFGSVWSPRPWRCFSTRPRRSCAPRSCTGSRPSLAVTRTRRRRRSCCNTQVTFILPDLT